MSEKLKRDLITIELLVAMLQFRAVKITQSVAAAAAHLAQSAHAGGKVARLLEHGSTSTWQRVQLAS